MIFEIDFRELLTSNEVRHTTIRKTYFSLHVFINMNPKMKRIRTQGSMDAQSIAIKVKGCDRF